MTIFLFLSDKTIIILLKVKRIISYLDMHANDLVSV